MARNAYYATAHWRTLKMACHERDGYRCTVPCCGSADGLVADHIHTRPNVDYPTSFDTLANTRSLCGYHDRQVKELASGKRRNEGKLRVVGADANGTPRDPNHHWNKTQ